MIAATRSLSWWSGLAPVAVTAFAAVMGCGGADGRSSQLSGAFSPTPLAAQATEPRAGDATASHPAGDPLPAPLPAPTPSAPAKTSALSAADLETSPPTKIGARHVLIQWMGSERAPKSVLRSREQAQELARDVLKRARAGEDLGRLAVDYSDEPNAGARGGSLGRFTHGQMVPAFEQVAFKLKVGEVSDIVETPFGFHVIQRTE